MLNEFFIITTPKFVFQDQNDKSNVKKVIQFRFSIELLSGKMDNI